MARSLPLATGIALVRIVVIALVFCHAFSCTSSKEGQAVTGGGHTNQLSIGLSQAGTNVTLPERTTLVVKLPAHPSGGYSWRVESVDQSVLRQVGKPRYVPRDLLIGASEDEYLYFRAPAIGATHLALTESRPWESSTSVGRFDVDISALAPYRSSVDGGLPFDFDNVDDVDEAADAGAVQTSQDPLTVISSCVISSPLPTAFNWCGGASKSECSPIRDQGTCGSCWAFATTGVFENVLRFRDWSTSVLSPQFLVSCNTALWGCSGGNEAHDYHLSTLGYGETVPGAVYESDFPYTGTGSSCNGPHPHHERINEWYKQPTSVNCIKLAIMTDGPVTASICEHDAFQNYTGGVFSTDEYCFLGFLNHMVTIVGWDDTDLAWIVRNSWGTSWGEGGYARVRYGTSGIDSNSASSVTSVAYQPSGVKEAIMTAIRPP